jgi:hypothetical protein
MTQQAINDFYSSVGYAPRTIFKFSDELNPKRYAVLTLFGFSKYLNFLKQHFLADLGVHRCKRAWKMSRLCQNRPAL